MSRKRQNYMKKADTLFSRIVRDRDQTCQMVGAAGVECSGYLQCCHIIGRGELSIRTDLDNAVAGCQAHHVYFTHRPAEWWDWVDTRFPGRLDELRSRTRFHRDGQVKVDWRFRFEALKEMADDA